LINFISLKRVNNNSEAEPPVANKQTVALLLAHTNECLFFNRKEQNVVYLVAAGTKEEQWVKKFLNTRLIALYNLRSERFGINKKLHDAEILKYSDINEILAVRGIINLFGWFHSRDAKHVRCLRTYFNKHGFVPLSAAFDLQYKLEHKIYFDRFLKKNGLRKPKSEIYIGGASLPRFTGKIVLQHPLTAGGEETFILEKSTDIVRLLRKGLIKNGKSYLVREYIDGPAYGITIIVSRDRIILSAIRRQCYGENTHSGRLSFNGIQWLPISFFSISLRRKMNKIFHDLGRSLLSIGYRGIANIDFIVDSGGDEIYILECNPRLSSSTVHVFAFPELISKHLLGNVLYNIYVMDRFPRDGKVRYYKIPETGFQGATLDINGFHLTKYKRVTIRRGYEPGLYRISKDTISFVSPDVRKLPRRGNYFMLSSAATKNEQYHWNDIVASIITNFQLYNLSTGEFTQSGVQLLNYFKEGFTAKKSQV